MKWISKCLGMSLVFMLSLSIQAQAQDEHLTETTPEEEVVIARRPYQHVNPPSTIPTAAGVQPDWLVGPHQGWFVRVALGAGYGTYPNLQISGADIADSVAIPLELAIGGYVIDNFAIHATFSGATMAAPFATMITSGSIGVGFTYYLTPIDIYFSSSVGVSRIVIDDDYWTYDTTNLGVSWELLIGKEWRVMPGISVGLAPYFMLSHSTTLENNTIIPVNFYSGGLMFSLSLSSR